MTKEELLKPRYRVLITYPNTNFKVGDILEWIEVTEYLGSKMAVRAYGKFVNDTVGCAWINNIENYPHLFKKLEWWEERELSDLPHYVLNISAIPQSVCISDWYIEEGKILLCLNKHRANLWGVLPATEQEYNDYINQKK